MKSTGFGRLTAIVVALVAVVVLAGAVSAAGGEYFVQADIVRGAEGQPKGPVCVPNSVFLPGESTVFRVKVYDANGGAYIGPEEAAARGMSVRVRIGDTVLPLHMGAHPPGAPVQDSYWTSHWVIPADYPAGAVNWSVEVTDSSGRFGSFEPIGQNIGIPALMVMPPAPVAGSQG